MHKVWVLALAVIVLTACQASAQLTVDPASGLDIPWNTSLPINMTNLENAMRAAAERRFLNPNGTVGDPIPANVTLTNTTGVVDNSTNIVNPLGCELRVPEGYTVDPFIGEWCYFTPAAGFMFRGVTSKEGKTYLQRYRLKTHKSTVPQVNLTANATANATLVATNHTTTPIRVNGTATVSSFLEYLAIYDNLATEEEIAQLDEEYGLLDQAFDHNELFESGFAAFLESDVMLSEQFNAAMLKAFRNAPSAPAPAPAAGASNLPAPEPVVLPPLPKMTFGKCAQQAADYIDCTGGALTDLVNGTEARGFCVDDQSSAVALLDIRDFISKYDRWRRQLKKFAQSYILNVAPTKNSTDKFNAEEDHVRLCFLPGTFVEKARYRTKGQFQTYPFGEAYGLFKPTIDIDCSSKYCRKSKTIRGKGPRNIFLNLAP